MVIVFVQKCITNTILLHNPHSFINNINLSETYYTWRAEDMTVKEK